MGNLYVNLIMCIFVLMEMSNIHSNVTDFAQAVTLIRQAQYDVLKVANTKLIELYWQLGRIISERVASAKWGKGVVSDMANYIAHNVPEAKGFSDKNLWRMKQFFELYQGNEKLSSLVREISWTNNLVIISRAKSDEEREFYLQLCVRERLASRELERQIKSCLYERTVLAEPKLSAVLREIAPQAKEVFRDNYVLEFK